MARLLVAVLLAATAACAALPTSPSDSTTGARTPAAGAARTTTASKAVAPAPPTRDVCVRSLELACQPGVAGVVPACWGDNDWGWVRLTSTGSCPELSPEAVAWTITPADRYIGAWHRTTKVPTAVWARSPWGEVKIEAAWPGGSASLTTTTAPNGGAK